MRAFQSWRGVRPLLRETFYKLESSGKFSSLSRVVVALRALEGFRTLHRARRLSKFEILNLQKYKLQGKSTAQQTCYIIGKGPSAAYLSDRHLNEVSQGFLIGLNNSGPGDLCPDLVLIEKEFSGEIYNFRSNLTDRTKLLSHVSPHEPTKLSELTGEFLVPGAADSPRKLYTSLNLMTSSASTAARFFVNTVNSWILREWGVVVGAQASVLRAIWIAWALGFTKVVLLGVDLIEIRPEGDSKHLTAVRQHGYHIPVDVLLAEVHALLVATGAKRQIVLGYPVGVLSQILPLYDWEE